MREKGEQRHGKEAGAKREGYLVRLLPVSCYVIHHPFLAACHFQFHFAAGLHASCRGACGVVLIHLV